jgi:hypothetical protein
MIFSMHSRDHPDALMIAGHSKVVRFRHQKRTFRKALVLTHAPTTRFKHKLYQWLGLKLPRKMRGMCAVVSLYSIIQSTYA